MPRLLARPTITRAAPDHLDHLDHNRPRLSDLNAQIWCYAEPASPTPAPVPATPL